MNITDLKKGDVFMWGKKPWDELLRFHSFTKYEDGRYCVMLMGVSYCGPTDKAGWHSFTWRNIDEVVYLPVFYLCEFKKSRGRPCIPVNGHRHFLPDSLNAINKSTEYCDSNNYWYKYQNII